MAVRPVLKSRREVSRKMSNNLPVVLEISPECKAERLDIFLARKLVDVSRSQIQKLIADGKVLRNNQKASKKDIISGGDRIEVVRSALVRDIKLAPQNIPLDILYEDEYLVAVNKPSGLVVHPGNGVRDGTLVNALLYQIGTLSEGSASDRPGIVHRLDKETSGAMIVAKTNNAHAAMASAFANRSVEKHYVGFCFGEPSESHGRIDLPLERSHRDPFKHTCSKGGKPSLTEYWLLRHRAGISAIYFKLHTGRTHQIRVHCSSKGFPILADSLYGGGKERLMRVSPLDRPFAAKIFKSFSRQALHARYLSFVHPFTGLRIHIEAPFPGDFNEAMAHFGDQNLFREPFGLTKS